MTELRHFFRVSTVLVISLLFFGCATPPEQIARDPAPLFSLPLSLDVGGRPVVPVKINGTGPYLFVFDTAATRTSIVRDVLDKIEAGGGDPIEARNVRVIGLTGAVTAPLTQIKSLLLGPASERGDTFTDFPVVILERWQAPSLQPAGIIGLDIIQRYAVVVDAPGGRIDFYAPDAIPKQKFASWRSAPLRPAGDTAWSSKLLMTDVDVFSATFPALLDTGAASTLGNNTLLDEIVVVPPVEELRRGRKVQGFTGPEAQTYRLRIYRLTIGDIVWEDEIMLITDALIFDELGFADRPVGLIGFDYFRDRAFALDFQAMRIHVDAPRREP